jgi:hypothetical protein
LTRHNGRAGKNGTYNPKHNDRRFDVENSEHIDPVRAKQNVYWNCYTGLDAPFNREKRETMELSFDKVEKYFYIEHYQEYVSAQNMRNEKTRHIERNRTVSDLLKNNKTCPEETIYQIGDIDESIPPESLLQIAITFFEILESRYGEYFHILDWALHVDEGTPHIHERHVFDCENRYGEVCPQQEKALEKMGIPLPEPDKPKGKNNNRKKTFDAMCRELLLDICENQNLYLDKEPVYGGRSYLEKQDYIIAKQKEKMASQEQTIETQKEKMEELSLKIEDVESLIDEVSDIAYDKAVEAVTDVVRAETKKEDIRIISDYQDWLMQPERNAALETRKYASARLDKVMEKIRSTAQKAIDKIQKSLMKPEIKETGKQQIREKARESIHDRLARNRMLAEKKNREKLAEKRGLGTERNYDEYI